jgi:hypothetical protein
MLYLGIDQHKRQLTVNLRAEDGSVVLKRQVSTEWEKVRAYFADLAENAGPEGGFLAILEVCGMNPWLLDMLREYGCRETVVIQPTERAIQKTDHRDAGGLSHLLWVHRQQFLDGKHPLGLRRIQPPTPQGNSGGNSLVFAVSSSQTTAEVQPPLGEKWTWMGGRASWAWQHGTKSDSTKKQRQPLMGNPLFSSLNDNLMNPLTRHTRRNPNHLVGETRLPCRKDVASLLIFGLGGRDSS